MYKYFILIPGICGVTFMWIMVRFPLGCGLMRRLQSSTDRELKDIQLWLVFIEDER